MTEQDRFQQAKAHAEDADELERFDLADDDGQTEDEPAGSFFAHLLGYN